MTHSSLVPERQLVFSPGLAATIGLEESILLQHLHTQFEHHSMQEKDGFGWISVPRAFLLQSLPFWQIEDLHRISRSLADKGVILIESAPLLHTDRLVFAINEPLRRITRAGSPAAHTPSAPATGNSAAYPTADATGYSSAHAATGDSMTASTPPPAGSIPAAARRGAGLLPVHWSPGEELLQILALNHNIPRQFALDQLEDFIFYWRERGETSHAWGNKFRQHVVSNWRHHQQNKAEAFLAPEPKPLDQHWRPSSEAMEIMARSEIDSRFIEDAIPEFILYWRERGAAPRELNSKFIQHIRIQWSRYTSSLAHSTEPRRIPDSWQPDENVFDILRMSHIDTEFAYTLLPEFIVYWKDSNQLHTSWNSKFLQHVKYHWAKRLKTGNTESHHGGQQGSHSTGRTRDRSLHEDLSDTSWAD
mgnify:CR=1 FL=1|tara:strand:+ start:30784 stop:32040 length:1257 start_codon:yes stop_codon:yes gene_type:complete